MWGEGEGEAPRGWRQLSTRRLHNGVGWIRHFKNKHNQTQVKVMVVSEDRSEALGAGRPPGQILGPQETPGCRTAMGRPLLSKDSGSTPPACSLVGPGPCSPESSSCPA